MADLEPKWSKHAFFNGGVSKNPTLQEAFNKAPVDSTSAQIADEILFRANLIDRPFYPEILKGLTDYLEGIENPVYYSNRLNVVNEDAIPKHNTFIAKDPEAYSVVGESSEEDSAEDSDNEDDEASVEVPTYSVNSED